MAEAQGIASCVSFEVLGGAFVEVLPILQDYGVRGSSSLPAGLFVVFSFEGAQDWLVCKYLFRLRHPSREDVGHRIDLAGQVLET